jgi:hypothetical protein
VQLPGLENMTSVISWRMIPSHFTAVVIVSTFLLIVLGVEV